MSSLLSKAVPTWGYPTYRPGMKVALFIPCFMDQFFPTAGIAAVKLLEQFGVRPVYPSEQTCCGQPAFNSGYKKDALEVMEKFHRVFWPYDLIVTPSSACAAMCRVFFTEADPDNPAAATGRRVWELSEFLVHSLGVTDVGASFPGKVALHVGCHGRRELGMADAAMTLLTHIRGLQYAPIPDVEECCGFGGTFSVKMPGTSLAMGKKKVANILRSGADLVATTDLSCAMHFGGIMRHDAASPKMEIVYLAELLLRHD